MHVYKRTIIIIYIHRIELCHRVHVSYLLRKCHVTCSCVCCAGVRASRFNICMLPLRMKTRISCISRRSSANSPHAIYTCNKELNREWLAMLQVFLILCFLSCLLMTKVETMGLQGQKV